MAKLTVVVIPGPQVIEIQSSVTIVFSIIFYHIIVVNIIVIVVVIVIVVIIVMVVVVIVIVIVIVIDIDIVIGDIIFLNYAKMLVDLVFNHWST